MHESRRSGIFAMASCNIIYAHTNENRRCVFSQIFFFYTVQRRWYGAVEAMTTSVLGVGGVSVTRALPRYTADLCERRLRVSHVDHDAVEPVGGLYIRTFGLFCGLFRSGLLLRTYRFEYLTTIILYTSRFHLSTVWRTPHR